MCGINAYISFEPNEDPSHILHMNTALQHRGPDASGYSIFDFGKGHLHLGANRLKIIDLKESGNQPFISADGRYALAYNGEIYNYISLRVPLQQKYKFTTGTDTEVLLYHLIEHGEKGIEMLEGMFAFVFADLQQQKILAARDRSGIKPLYFAQTKKSIVISSELKGIFASKQLAKSLDTTQLSEYLHFKSARQPNTFFQDVKSLQAGWLLEIKEQTIHTRRWKAETSWQWNEINPETTLKEAEGHLLLALEKHLRADVPCGLLLSGGVDSTLMLALLHSMGVNQFPCYTFAHQKGQSSTSDYHYAEKAGKQFDAEMHTLQAEIQMLDRFGEHISAMDQPIADSAGLMTFLISEQAKKDGIKVLLSGAGADELFAGYNRHLAFHRYLNTLKNYPRIVKLLKSTHKLIPGEHDAFRLIRKFASKISNHPIETWTNFCSTDDLCCSLLPLAQQQEQGLHLNNEEWLAKGLQDDLERYLVGDVLSITDNMSMAKSVEVRVPYLDQHLIRFATSIKPSSLLTHGRKWILRELLNRRNGGYYANRKKEGFGMPLQHWIEENPSHPLMRKLAQKNAPIYQYLAYEKVKEILKLQLVDQRNLSTELWSLIVLNEWLEQNFSA